MSKELSFIKKINTLKNIERFKDQFYWKDYPKLDRYESVADHTWRLTALVVLFSDKLSKGIDLEKALMMATLHDLPEVYAGDYSPMGAEGTGEDTHAFNHEKALKKEDDEHIAAKKLFGLLDEKDGTKLFELWNEYEENKTFEARVVKALDKIEAMLQVLEYRRGEMFPEHLEFTIKYGLKGCDVDPAIEQFGKEIAQELRAKFIEFDKNSYKPDFV